MLTVLMEIHLSSKNITFDTFFLRLNDASDVFTGRPERLQFRAIFVFSLIITFPPYLCFLSNFRAIFSAGRIENKVYLMFIILMWTHLLPKNVQFPRLFTEREELTRSNSLPI